MSYVIGVTGGIGCGKSTVLSILKEKYNCYVIEADKVGHLVMEPNQSAYNEVVEFFINELGLTNILNADRTINNAELGKIVFNDSEKLSKLNAIVHPKVKKYIVDIIKSITSSPKCDTIFVVEAALLIEAGYDDICDDVWYVYSEDEIRRKRLKLERNYSDEKIDSIIKNQLRDDEFRLNCKYVIDNSDSIENTKRQIDERMESIYGRN